MTISPSAPFAPCDPTLPLILPDTVLDGDIFDPLALFVSYVNQLLAGGYTPATLPPDFAALYRVDYYNAQVRNGGHSQFIHNSGDALEDNLAAAARGAALLELPALETVIADCAAWCRANPEEAARQTGFDVRAEALDPLDQRLYGGKMTDEALAALIADQPQDVATRLKARLYRDRPGMYDRSDYHIAFWLWVARHPNLRLVPADGLAAARQDVLDRSPFAAKALAARALEQLHQAIPTPPQLALFRAMAKVRGSQGQPVFFRATQRSLDAAPGEECHLIETTERRLILRMSGGAVTLSEARPPRLGLALRLRQVLGLVPRDVLAKAMLTPRPGAQIASAPVDGDLPALLARLHLPEALALWTDDPERHIHWARGTLTGLDTAAPALTWRFAMGDDVVTMEASGTGVLMSAAPSGREARYPAEMLSAYRAERQSP